MKRLGLSILGILFLCGLAFQAGASELPAALEGINLSSAHCISDAEAMNIRGEAWSPNGFSRGQCTWYVDGRYKEWSKGWTIHFSKNSGRDAYNWYSLVDGFTNGSKKAKVGKGQEGHAGDIMVINRWKDKDGRYRSGAYGHVAFVEQMLKKSNQWKISHAHWATGSATRNIEGKKIYQAIVSKSGSNVAIGGAKVPLRGFIYRK